MRKSRRDNWKASLDHAAVEVIENYAGANGLVRGRALEEFLLDSPMFIELMEKMGEAYPPFSGEAKAFKTAHGTYMNTKSSKSDKQATLPAF